MSTNTYFSQNVSSAPNSSQTSFRSTCFNSTPGSTIFTAFTVTNILFLLPISIYILVFGFHQWRKQRAGEAMNPIDVFTYHMVAMEMMGVCGSIVCCCGAFVDRPKMLLVGCNMFAIISCIKMSFHVLTCVERYVAVVRPLTYLTLSKMGGVMIRNISIGCVWSICTLLVALRILLNQNFTMILFFCNLVVSLMVSSFCSLSVLRVLIVPAPGENSGSRGKVDKGKQRAFVTITAIMSVLILRFMGNLVCLALATSSLLNFRAGCTVRMTGVWFCLPSSYVLPLLFLHRAQKLPCFKYKSESG